MENRFDQLCRELVESTTRREALRRLGGFLLGSIVASCSLDRVAWARGPCARRCARELQNCRHRCNRDFQGRNHRQQRLDCLQHCREDYEPGPCVRDCDNCRRACHGSDECFELCDLSCRQLCRNFGYPAGDQLDYCQFVCAQCTGTDRTTCPNAAKGGAADCCPPGVNCCGGRCCHPGCASCENGQCIDLCPTGAICCSDGECHYPLMGDSAAVCCPSPDGSFFACGDEYQCTQSHGCCPDDCHVCADDSCLCGADCP